MTKKVRCKVTIHGTMMVPDLFISGNVYDVIAYNPPPDELVKVVDEHGAERVVLGGLAQVDRSFFDKHFEFVGDSGVPETADDAYKRAMGII